VRAGACLLPKNFDEKVREEEKMRERKKKGATGASLRLRKAIMSRKRIQEEKRRN